MNRYCQVQQTIVNTYQVQQYEVERQIADMKVVFSNTESLNKFFHDHLQFVKGSNVSSVFFSKEG
ncbi:conjugative transfer protein [Orientia tsutsugamushi str. Gilliam]|uniref:Conjugative transfer protein n=1 Tax=Orientia tsutsugamushi str. Gilliam TaxID=1359184 RepID=A0A2U3QTX7_ORITS|nr:conjugative transfer protein [Orientia tsutsugamushi str. Gilliam]